MTKELTPIQKLIAKKIEEKPELEKMFQEEQERLEVAIALMKLRESLGLSQRELAEKAGKPQSTIARIENGRMNVSFKIIRDIAHSVGKEVRLEFV